MVELAGFTLAGSAASKLRAARRRFVEREGAVFRPLIETVDEYQGRVSFKVFNPAFSP